MIHDQHVHSYYSFDSKQPIEEYLDEASKLGLNYFVLTDHCDFDHLNTGKDLFFDVKKQREELEQLQKKYPNIKILFGIEMGYRPQDIERTKKVLMENRFDLINLSLHELDDIDYFYPDRFIQDGIDSTLNTYFLKQLEMVRDFDNFDVLCHIDYGFKTAYKIDNSLKISKYEDIIISIMKELIRKEKAFEINTRVQEVLPIEHTKYLLSLYKKLGGQYLTLSSDAHDISRFRKDFDKYIPIIKDAGFDYLTYFVDRKKHLYII